MLHGGVDGGVEFFRLLADDAAGEVAHMPETEVHGAVRGPQPPIPLRIPQSPRDLGGVGAQEGDTRNYSVRIFARHTHELDTFLLGVVQANAVGYIRDTNWAFQLRVIPSREDAALGMVPGSPIGK